MYSTPPPRAMRPLAWLPNRVGPFIGVQHDGKQVTCRVVVGADGLHYVADAMLPRLAGWLPMPMGAGR